MESYSVQAILKATDSGFASTMNKAEASLDSLNDKYEGAFQDKNGRWHAANGRFLTMKEQSDMLGSSFDNTSNKVNSFTNTMLGTTAGIAAIKAVSAAVDIITNSVSGAIDRFDTLNKYPVVMESLGYSADEVSESMDKMSDGIDGLPTTLDDIVNNVQRMTIATGDLQTGTDTALALNDAFLSSGASVEDATRGVQQYIQMLSRGEVDLESWRTLQETMPLAMSKVADSFRDDGVGSVNDLYDALQAGDITFDEFNQHLVDLDAGVGGFADLARENSAGIKTSFKNIGTAITKGIADVITAIDTSLKNAGLGSITENLDKVKVAVQEFFKFIVDQIPSVMNAIGDFINLIKRLKPEIMLAAGALLTFRTYLISLAVVTTITNMINKFTTALTILRTKGLMGVIKSFMSMLNPVALVITAIVILAGVFLYLWKTNEGFRDAVIAIWNKIKEVAIQVWGIIAKVVSVAMKVIFVIVKAVLLLVVGLWNGFKTYIWPLVKAIFTLIAKIVFMAMAVVAATVKIGLDILKALWNAFETYILPVVQALWDAVKAIFELAWEEIKFVVKTALTLIEMWFQVWGTIVKTIFTVAWNVIKSIFSTALDMILTVVKSVFTQIENIFDLVMGVVEGITDIALGIIHGDWDQVMEGIKGIVKSFGAFITDTFKNIMSTAWNLVKRGIKGIYDSFMSLFDIDLFEAGKAIMQSFFDGLLSIWENIKDFIGGIGSWIVEHKGPISYDKVLLIPAGKAIMNGLNAGLTTGFVDVQKNVGGMASKIAEAFNGTNVVDVATTVNKANSNINGQIDHRINADRSNEPATINLRLGNQKYSVFIDDIAEALGNGADINLAF